MCPSTFWLSFFFWSYKATETFIFCSVTGYAKEDNLQATEWKKGDEKNKWKYKWGKKKLQILFIFSKQQKSINYLIK